MALSIVVCVKQTPSSTSVAVDPATGAVKTDGLPFGINPFDEYAVEEALRIKEKVPGSTVSVLSVGPARAEETVRAALAVGADEGALLSDPAFEGGDSLATAYLLSLAVRKLAASKPVSLVLCGKQTNDGESGQVGPALAAWLGWPGASSVRKIGSVSDSAVSVERLMEDGVDSLKLPLPCVLSTTKEINEPRLPSLKGKMAAKKAVIQVWKAADLGADAALVGRNSATSVVKTSPTPARKAGTVVEGADPQQKAAALVHKLKELKFL